MLSFKCLLLLLCSILYVTADSSAEVGSSIESLSDTELSKFLVMLGWEVERLGVLSGISEELSEDANITIVASQNIYNADGSLKEIRTVELFLVKLGETKVEVGDEGDDDIDDLGALRELKLMFIEASEMGLPLQLTMLKFEKTGEVTEAIYMDENMTYVLEDGLSYMNTTLVVHDKKLIEEKIKLLKSELLPVSVLKWDVDGKFLAKESIIVPEFLAYIDLEEDATPEIIENVLSGTSWVILNNFHELDSVPKEIATYLKQKMPGYAFHVVSGDSVSSHINKDFFVMVSYYFTNLETDELTYQIYGVKLSKA